MMGNLHLLTACLGTFLAIVYVGIYEKQKEHTGQDKLAYGLAWAIVILGCINFIKEFL